MSPQRSLPTKNKKKIRWVNVSLWVMTGSQWSHDMRVGFVGAKTLCATKCECRLLILIYYILPGSYSLGPWIHSKSSEITLWIKTPFVVMFGQEDWVHNKLTGDWSLVWEIDLLVDKCWEGFEQMGALNSTLWVTIIWPITTQYQ